MPIPLIGCVCLFSVAIYQSCGIPAVQIEYAVSEGYRFSRQELSAIQNIADAAVTDARPLLPTLPEQIVLQVRIGDDVSSDLGASATWASHTIYWTVDPHRPEGVRAIADAHLRPTLFHELHHMARGETGFYSLMDRVVSEGLATAFQRDAAGATYPWSEYPDEVSEWVSELLALPPHVRGVDWMIRHPDGRRWIGIRAGTYLVDRAMQASGKSAAELATSSTEDILRMAQVGVS